MSRLPVDLISMLRDTLVGGGRVWEVRHMYVWWMDSVFAADLWGGYIIERGGREGGWDWDWDCLVWGEGGFSEVGWRLWAVVRGVAV